MPQNGGHKLTLVQLTEDKFNLNDVLISIASNLFYLSAIFLASDFPFCLIQNRTRYGRVVNFFIPTINYSQFFKII